MRFYLGLFAAVLAVEVEVPAEGEGEEKKEYSVMDDVTIAMVTEVIDGNSFKIGAKGDDNKPIVLRIGTIGEVAPLSALTKYLGKNMIVYRPFPDEMQQGDGQVHADVWTSDGLHIGLALLKEGLEPSGRVSDFTKDILSVAAQAEKEKSYKELGDAMNEQAKYDKERVQEVKDAESLEVAKEKDWMLWIGILCAIGVFAVPFFVAKPAPAVKKDLSAAAAEAARAGNAANAARAAEDRKKRDEVEAAGKAKAEAAALKGGKSQ